MKTQMYRISLFLACLALASCGDSDSSAQMSAEDIQLLHVQSASFEGMAVAVMRTDAAAMAQAERLFKVQCFDCHGPDASTRTGVRDLDLAVFNYGDSETDIRTSIADGRVSSMPGFGSMMGEVEMGSLVAYLRSLRNAEELVTFSDTAQLRFNEHCISCHGPDAHGNPALGVPDLTDAYSRHGNSLIEVRMVITRGVEAQSPAFSDRLTVTEVDLLTAYLLNMRE